ncbi:MAG: DUF4124 domain-containing protein [Deltaproteobacteria bacterium]|nr:DUF4124 domain-containing protein [Deltaproteobacteria bacterium]
MERRVRFALALSMIGALATSSVQAQALYRYVDEQGGVHFVDSPSKVPPSRRSSASEVASDPGHVPRNPTPSVPPRASLDRLARIVTPRIRMTPRLGPTPVASCSVTVGAGWRVRRPSTAARW